MRPWLILAAMAGLLTGCPEKPKPDGGTPEPYAHCLDRPTLNGAPANGELPCELLPPGFQR